MPHWNANQIVQHMCVRHGPPADQLHTSERRGRRRRVAFLLPRQRSDGLAGQEASQTQTSPLTPGPASDDSDRLEPLHAPPPPIHDLCPHWWQRKYLVCAWLRFKRGRQGTELRT